MPQVTASAAGLLPRIKRFTLVGTFSSGHYSFDNGVALVNYQDAAKLPQLPEGVTGYHIMLHDPMQAPLVRERLTPQLPYGVYASDWSVDNASYFSAVQIDKGAIVVGQHGGAGVAHFFAGGVTPLQLEIDDAADGRKQHEKEKNVVEEKLSEAHLRVP